MNNGAWPVIGIMAILLGASGARAADVAPAAEAAPAAKKAVVIQLQGEIDDYNRDALIRRFDEARKLGAQVVILNIDSYGGLVTSGLEISRFLKRQDDLHTIAYVRDKAISAGAMIAMACDEIVVSGSCSIGDCAPIIFNGADLEAMPAAERAKAESPVLEDFDESVRRNHHDPVLAAAMVDVTRSVYLVQNQAGEKRFVDAKEYTELTAPAGGWSDAPNCPVPIDGPTTLLTVDSDQAVRYGLATQQASTVESLAQQRGYDVLADLTPGWGENLVETLSGTLVRGLLIVIFLQCLYIVLHAPGHGVAETIGLVALGLMLGVPMLTGYAQWWEILMIFIGLLLIACEIILPSHFLPGITGAILFTVGLILTFVPKNPLGLPTLLENPKLSWELMHNGFLVVAGAMASSIFLWFWIGRFLPRMPMFSRLILTTPGGATVAAAAQAMPPMIWPPIGAVGKAMSELKPGGSAEFFDPNSAGARMTSVVSEAGFLPPGTEIVVRAVSGPTVLVGKRS